ncbi:MAG TPA: hypothetical protein VH331_14270 [Allosphingosinicella sp.]|jgi:hypothetical protein|nr:hypothetical protein [Allosphingosinicella sp.]
MHIHLPKPLHGWREFIGEVGIIVIGVLIALGAEQLIEAVHWREKVAETKEQLNGELHDDARSAYTWLAVHRCLEGQLDAAEAAVGNARETGEIPPLPAYTPPLALFTSDAWLDARSLQVADHIGPEAMRDYARLYFFPRELELNIVQLHQLAAELQPLTHGLHHVSSEEAGAYQRLIGKIRELQDRTAYAETLLLKRSPAPVRLSGAEMQEAVLAARSWAGACAGRVDLNWRPAPGD